MDTLRDLFYALVQLSHGAVQWILGRERTAQTGRWFGAIYRDQPLLFGLIVTWLAFCAVPLAVFIGYATFWAIVACGVFWAIFLFWAGLGLLFLIPALFVATGLSLTVFLWAAVTYYVGVRLLAAAGYQAPFISGGGEDSAAPLTSATIIDSSEPAEVLSDKPPSYARLPLSMVKSNDIEPRADFGTPPLTSPGDVPVSTK
ncbi:hypothetical protein SEPCBS57363_006398 [Sporothrix epigloea]|uniref:Uncharacterized protein n=1 Tax=Sporothrix epigloea TaxID=1892477 RepID=A0ABP0E388_9PEZI